MNTPKTIGMRNLTGAELDEVSGGSPHLVAAFVLGVIGGKAIDEVAGDLGVWKDISGVVLGKSGKGKTK